MKDIDKYNNVKVKFLGRNTAILICSENQENPKEYMDECIKDFLRAFGHECFNFYQEYNPENPTFTNPYVRIVTGEDIDSLITKHMKTLIDEDFSFEKFENNYDKNDDREEDGSGNN